jgi:hypothetical protein
MASRKIFANFRIIFNWAANCLQNLATLLLALIHMCVWEDRFGSQCKEKRGRSKEKMFRTIMFGHDRAMIFLNLEMVKYLTCEP